MAQVGQEIRYRITVTDLFGVVVTGLANGDFVKALWRNASGSLTAASETVTVAEIGSGKYWITYTPTLAVLYVLEVSHATNVVSPGEFQDDVEAGVGTPSGSYLTTRAHVKTALGITDTGLDAAIDLLLAEVTDEVHDICGRVFFEATVTEYPRVRGVPFGWFEVERYPISAVANLWISTAIPRVYDADSLLVSGTDYIVNDANGTIELAAPVWHDNVAPGRMAKIEYTGGYASVPGDVEAAAIEIIAAKLYKRVGKLYHLTNSQAGDGSVSGIRFDDYSDATKRTLDRRTRFVL